MMTIRVCVFILFAIFAGSFITSAKITLPALVNKNMVLQRTSRVNLWGSSKPSSEVTVTTSWDNRTYSTRSDSRGNWLAKIETVQAGGPYQITISDGEKITLDWRRLWNLGELPFYYVQIAPFGNPVAVRYAWKEWVAGELFNNDNLPASSFRTDNW